MKKQTIIYIGIGVLFTVTTLVLLIERRKKNKLIERLKKDTEVIKYTTELLESVEKKLKEKEEDKKEPEKKEADAPKS